MGNIKNLGKSVNFLRWHSIIMRWNFFLNCIVVSRKERFESIFSICSKQLRNSTAEFICIQLVKNCEYANRLKVSSVQKFKHIFHPFYKIQVFFNILWNNGPHAYRNVTVKKVYLWKHFTQNAFWELLHT